MTYISSHSYCDICLSRQTDDITRIDWKYGFFYLQVIGRHLLWLNRIIFRFELKAHCACMQYRCYRSSQHITVKFRVVWEFASISNNRTLNQRWQSPSKCDNSNRIVSVFSMPPLLIADNRFDLFLGRAPSSNNRWCCRQYGNHSNMMIIRETLIGYESHFGWLQKQTHISTCVWISRSLTAISTVFPTFPLTSAPVLITNITSVEASLHLTRF